MGMGILNRYLLVAFSLACICHCIVKLRPLLEKARRGVVKCTIIIAVSTCIVQCSVHRTNQVAEFNYFMLIENVLMKLWHLDKALDVAK